VPIILQELPLSCEFAGMRMVSAALLGTAPDEEELLDCMPRDPNPYLGFRGDPAGYNLFADGTINWENYGAYAPAVAEALNNCVLQRSSGEFEAQALRGVSYQQVAQAVLDGYPVIVWVAKRQDPETKTVGTPEDPVPLVFGEHVWVVVGYHEDGTFEIHDPYPQKSGKPTTVTPQPAAYSPPTRIRIPKINVDADVVEVGYEIKEENGEMVTVWKVADFAAGYHLGSAYPGHPGNTVIAGHNNIRGRVFRHLLDLLPGDDIYLYVGEQEFHYLVAQRLLFEEKGMPEEIRRENAQWIQPTEEERLTLVSCWPFVKPDHRVVVIARPIYE